MHPYNHHPDQKPEHYQRPRNSPVPPPCVVDECCVSPSPNSYVETLTSKVVVLGGGALRK